MPFKCIGDTSRTAQILILPIGHSGETIHCFIMSIAIVIFMTEKDCEYAVLFSVTDFNSLSSFWTLIVWSRAHAAIEDLIVRPATMFRAIELVIRKLLLLLPNFRRRVHAFLLDFVKSIYPMVSIYLALLAASKLCNSSAAISLSPCCKHFIEKLTFAFIIPFLDIILSESSWHTVLTWDDESFVALMCMEYP